MSNANASAETSSENKNFNIAAIIIIAITIIASIGAILLAVVPSKDKTTSPTTGYDDPDDPEDDETAYLTEKPESEELSGTVAEIELYKKAGFILGNGQTDTTDMGKSFDAQVQYQTTTPSRYFFNSLNDSRKLAMITPILIDSSSSLGTDTLSKLSSNTCSHIFYQSNCSKVNLKSYIGDVGIINKDNETINKTYANYFGETNNMPTQSNSCPRVILDSNLKKYVYNNSCYSGVHSKPSTYYFYFYDQEATNNYAYVYFASAVYVRTGNASVSKMKLFDNMDQTGTGKSLKNPDYFTINEDNYDNYTHYRMVFKNKDGNYIYQSLNEDYDY